MSLLGKVDCSCAAAIAKTERAMSSMFSENGLLYFNNAIIPTENVNVTLITNTITDFSLKRELSLPIITRDGTIRQKWLNI